MNHTVFLSLFLQFVGLVVWAGAGAIAYADGFTPLAGFMWLVALAHFASLVCSVIDREMDAHSRT